MADYEGRNVTLRCNRFLDGHKSITYWKSSQPSYDGYLQNKSTISLILTANHDDMKVYCGTEEQPEMANFTLRIYRMQSVILTTEFFYALYNIFRSTKASAKYQ